MSNVWLWVGRIATWFCALFLLFDATLHLWAPQFVADAFSKLGVPIALSRPLGALEIIGLVLTLVPRTALLGVAFFTAYLGGATAIQARVGGDAWFSVFCGLLLWIGLYFQYPKVRDVFPIHKTTAP